MSNVTYSRTFRGHQSSVPQYLLKEMGYLLIISLTLMLVSIPQMASGNGALEPAPLKFQSATPTSSQAPSCQYEQTLSTMQIGERLVAEALQGITPETGFSGASESSFVSRR